MTRTSFHLQAALLAALTLGCGGENNPTPGETGVNTTGGSADTSGSTTAMSTPTTSDGSTGGSMSGTQGTTGSGPTSEPVTTTGSAPDSTSTSPDVTSTPDTTPDTDAGTTSGTTGTTESPGTSTGLPSDCPPEQGDDVCAMCLKQNCCDEALACFEDPDCACFFGCLMMGNEPPMCAQMCGIQNPGQNPALAALFGCNSMSCGEVCGG